MSAWERLPRAVRRKAIQTALSDPGNVASVTKQLANLKAAYAKDTLRLQAMAEAIEDTEALLGEVRA